MDTSSVEALTAVRSPEAPFDPNHAGTLAGHQCLNAKENRGKIAGEDNMSPGQGIEVGWDTGKGQSVTDGMGSPQVTERSGHRYATTLATDPCIEVEARTDWPIAPTSVACQEVRSRRKVRQRMTYRSPSKWLSDAPSDPRTP